MPESVPQMLFDAMDRDPDREAIRYPDGGAWKGMTRRQMVTEIARVAALLAELGVGKGTPVAIVSETRREWSGIDFAVLCLGGVTIGIYPSLTAEAVAYQLAHSGATVCVVENEAQAAKIASLRSQLPELQHVLSIDPVPGLRSARDLASQPDITWLREQAGKWGPNDVATWIYTSGTTGNPKAAVLTHGAFWRIAHATFKVIETRPGDSLILFLPLAHSLQRFTLYAGLLQDGVGWYAPSIQALPQTLLEAKPTALASVPRMLEKIKARAEAAAEERGTVAARLFKWAFAVGMKRSEHLERKQPVPFRLRVQYRVAERLVFDRVRKRMGGNLRLLVCGGSRLDVDVARWFHAIGVVVLEGWGLTETCAPATVNREDDYRFGTVGKPLPGVEVRIAEDGEVLVRGDGLFVGYAKDETATKDAFTEGWFKTGDIGEIDADGFLKITDRKKEILITAAGKNIPPVNIEKRIERSPYVSVAVAIGDDKPYLTALLVPDVENLDAYGKKMGWPAEDLRARLARPEVQSLLENAVNDANRDLARFEQIKKWEALPVQFSVETGELTPSLKLKRRVVAQRYADAIGRLYEGTV